MYFTFEDCEKYFQRISYEKQLTIAVLSSERAYHEAMKLYPKFINQKTNFRFLLDELWKHLAEKSSLKNEDWFAYVSEIQKKFKKKGDYYFQGLIGQIIGLLSMTIGIIIWKEDKPNYWASSCFNLIANIVSDIYDLKEVQSDLDTFYADKEWGWMTKAAILLEETNEQPTSYLWFTQRITEYERSKVSPAFSRKYQKYIDAEASI